MRRLSGALVPAFLLAMLLAASSGWAEDVAPSQGEVNVLLTYAEDGFANRTGLDVDRYDVRFKVEPEYADKDVVRGPIVFSYEPLEYIGFAWDEAANLLYVDANRDQDLTNDPGPYHGLETRPDEGIFEDVRVRLDHDGIPVDYRLRMAMNDLWRPYVEVTSGWQGVVTLDGQDYEIRIVDNLSGDLALGQFTIHPPSEASPEQESDALPDLSSRRSDGLPKYIAFANVTYALDASFEATPDGTGMRVGFSQPSEPLGEVQLQGAHIKELHLRRNDREGPRLTWISGDTFRAPLGDYILQRVTLEGGWTRNGYWNGTALVVKPDEPAQLAVGGPLKHALSVARSGGYLILTYASQDRNGEIFTSMDRSSAPRFAIYRGDTRLASGNFEYG